MAESWGPDAELEELRRAYEQARRQYDATEAEVGEILSPRIGDVDELARRYDVAELARQAAAERADRQRQSLQRAAAIHPAKQYQEILEEAENIQAPELSGLQWFMQNPSLLEAVPLPDEARRDQARLAHVLKRVNEAANSRSPTDPFHWSNYQGPEAQHMADLQVLAAEHYGLPGTDFKGNAERRRQLESPYAYRPFGRDDEGEFIPFEGHMDEAMRPLSALYSGAYRWKDNFLSGGAAVADGRLTDAAKDFGYALPNLVSPSFHRGGAEMEGGWRQYVSPGEAKGLDMAASLPVWLARGLYPRRPGTGLSVSTENRIRSVRDELLQPLYRQAAKKYHPDRGGTQEAMQKVNAAFDAGDAETLRRLAQ
jgi:hypothetical protein